MHPVGAGGLDALPHDGAARQICAGAEDDGADAKHRTGTKYHGADVSVLAAKLRHLRLPQRQVFLPLQRVLHHLLVQPPVRLRPQRPHRRAFGAVEHPVLDAGAIRSAGHFTAQRVQLPDKVSLAGAADGGVAGHIAHRVQIDGEADGAHPQPRRCQRRLDARVTGSDNGDIKFSRKKLFHSQHIPVYTFIRSHYIWYDPQVSLCNLSKISENKLYIMYKFALAKLTKPAYTVSVNN